MGGPPLAVSSLKLCCHTRFLTSLLVRVAGLLAHTAYRLGVLSRKRINVQNVTFGEGQSTLETFQCPLALHGLFLTMWRYLARHDGTVVLGCRCAIHLAHSVLPVVDNSCKSVVNHVTECHFMCVYVGTLLRGYFACRREFIEGMEGLRYCNRA